MRFGSGFIYAVARAGVTGGQTQFQDDLAKRMATLREVSDLPVAVGFGVATTDDLQVIKPFADYAIVGSAALRVLQAKGLEGLQEYWQQMVAFGHA